MRPASGNAPAEVYAAEDAIPAADIARDADALFCCEAVFGSANAARIPLTLGIPSPNSVIVYAKATGPVGNSIAVETDAESAEFGDTTLNGGRDANEGILFSLGDSTTGLLVGVNGTGELVARFGDGDAAPITNGSRVVVPAGLVPKDRITRLSVAVHISTPQEIVVWFDGNQIARADMGGTLTDWAADEDGAFVDVAASIPVEAGITAAYDGNVSSSLRYHPMRAPMFRTGG